MRKMPMIWGSDGMSGKNPCAACGKELKSKNTFFVHVIDGGSNVLHPEDEALYVEDAGEMGHHEIGSECAKKFGKFAYKG